MSWRPVVIVIIALLLAPALAAQVPAWQQEVWVKRLAESGALMKRGDYERALPLSRRVIAEMVDGLGPGDASMQAFGIALTHKALAHAGLGQQDDALWYWHIVLNLYPAFAKSDLSMFGAAGQFLTDHVALAAPGKDRQAVTEAVTYPVIVKRVEPDCPRAAQWFGVQGQLVVATTITSAGRITSPTILKPLPAPTLSFTALEAVRKWTFRPGTRNGRPTNTRFILTINYKLTK